MGEIHLKTVNDINIVIVELDIALLRAVQPRWEALENNSLFFRKNIIIDISKCGYVHCAFIGTIIRGQI